MNDSDLKALIEKVKRIDERTRSIESSIHSLFGLLLIAAVVLSLIFWGPGPTLFWGVFWGIVYGVAVYVGRRAGKRAQAYLDQKGISQPADSLNPPSAPRHEGE